MSAKIPIEYEFIRLMKEWLPSPERMDLVNKVVQLVNECPRAKLLLPYLTMKQKNEMSWFDEPASTRYHGASIGGLARHSLGVYYMLKKLNLELPANRQLPEETLVICGLYHDLCKSGIYYPKHLQSKALAATPYETQDLYPMGHGEKSVVIINEILRPSNMCLTQTESILIRWHMGPFDRMYATYEAHLKAAYQFHLMLYIADHFCTMMEGDE